jgi:hypothetical protein
MTSLTRLAFLHGAVGCELRTVDPNCSVDLMGMYVSVVL